MPVLTRSSGRSLALLLSGCSASAKKPVIVRFHGGGFYGGSSNSPGGDGEMLSRFGDCVVITVNHRLSALGYLWLGDYHDTDLPYVVETPAGKLVALPHSDFTDNRVLRGSPRDFLDGHVFYFLQH